MTKVAFPTDEHYPYQDERARSIALQIVRDFNPDVIISGSDGLDFYGVSSFDKNPKRVKVTIQDEIALWKKGQHEWQQASPNAKRLYLLGNHEDRLRRYLWKHPELSSLEALKLENVLELESLGIQWPEKTKKCQEIVVENVLVIRHGSYVRKFSAQSAKAELEADRFGLSILTGHTHRGGSFFARTRSGLVQAHECFCLCRLNPEYVQFPDWHQGIVLAEIINRKVLVHSIPFNGNRAIWNGKEYSAK